MGAETDVVEPMSSDDVRAADNETANEPSQQRKRKKRLYQSLRDLMEFYLGDANLGKKKFVYDHIQGKPFVYMELAIFLSFNKIKALTSKVEDLAASIANSEFLKVSDDGTCVCRTTPLRKKENEDECTIYVEQLSSEMDQDTLKKVFSAFGPIDYISIPRYANTNKCKGFAFIEFQDAETAKKVVEVLSSKGCGLSTRMTPAEMISIKTFECKETKETYENKKIKFEDIDNGAEEEVKDNKSENSHRLKRKPSHKASDSESEANNYEGTSNVTKSKKKRKLSDTDEIEQKRAKLNEGEKDEPQTSMGSKSSKRKHSVDKTEPNTSEPDEKKTKRYNEGDDDTGEESKAEDGEEGTDKKKKKKRKKVKKDKVTAVSLGLKVLSKREWKYLRNKYLNQQRDTSRSVKQHLLYSKRTSGEAEPSKRKQPVNTVPGTVVKITLDEPVTNNKAAKMELRIHPEIKYVDATEGSNIVYLRTSTSELASSLLQSQNWSTMEIISGEEEVEYWDKIKRDREEQFNKVKPNRRGRTKLLKKAERIQAANTFEGSAPQS